MTYAQPMGDPTNVVGRRIGAYVIDAIVIGILSFALLYPLFMSASETAPSGTVECAESDFGDQDGFGTSTRVEVDSQYCFELGDEVRYVPDDEAGSFTAQVYGISIGLQALNFVVLQGVTGASLGKLILGLRVIRQDGKKAGLGWAALRWVLLFVDAFCCVLPGLILVFTTKGHRRIGDMAAGTLVVRKESVGTPPVVPGLTAPEGYAPQAYGTPGYGGQGYGNQGYGGQGPGYGGSSYGGSTPGGWAPPAASSAPSGDGPTWDAARNAYIQYDQGEAAWKQWDDASSSWKPIDQ